MRNKLENTKVDIPNSMYVWWNVLEVLTGGSKTQIHRLHILHRLTILLKIADDQSVFYFLKKTQTGRALLNGNS